MITASTEADPGTPANAPETPYLAVDLEVMERNLRRAADDARERGIALRPHAKTHKVPEIGRRQLELGAAGLTLATVAEAEVFAAAGFSDIFLAYPVWPSAARVTRLRDLAERASLRLGIDSVESAQALGSALAGAGVEVLVEVDSGHHRSGVQPSDAAEVALAAARSGLRIVGVFTFPGHGYAPGAGRQAAQDEASAITIAAEAIHAAGLEISVRSGGSTPTRADADPAALTELRPGVYVFNDAQQVELGTCSFEEVALSAMATVVSRSGQHAIVDAGSKVLGADRAAWATGFGRLPDTPAARIIALSEHHATIRFPDGEPVPERGSVLRIVPNHVCATVNLADELLVVRAGEIVDSWAVAARGANT
ncbi:MAG TPA: alanine racemase [Terrimesophilobacter sp.]|jgi:Predicted amino acid aldolase or racemase|uniref:alanine racemase n=1 Tax=Terrimesophilobacter sp. TaxID=2906435 RepID=UPI002F92F11B